MLNLGHQEKTRLGLAVISEGEVLPLVEHDSLKAKLSKAFDRLKIGDEKTRDLFTAELNRLAAFLIENCPKQNYDE